MISPPFQGPLVDMSMPTWKSGSRMGSYEAPGLKRLKCPSCWAKCVSSFGPALGNRQGMSQRLYFKPELLVTGIIFFSATSFIHQLSPAKNNLKRCCVINLVEMLSILLIGLFSICKMMSGSFYAVVIMPIEWWRRNFKSEQENPKIFNLRYCRNNV